MFRNHYTTIAAWIIVYISLWLSRDNLVSSKFSKNNCHTGFVSRIIETMKCKYYTVGTKNSKKIG